VTECQLVCCDFVLVCYSSDLSRCRVSGENCREQEQEDSVVAKTSCNKTVAKTKNSSFKIKTKTKIQT